MTPTLLCTVRNCHLPQRRDGDRYLCDRNHSFDIARSGYINLLQPQDRRSRVPGDRDEAVEARHRLTDRGIFAPLLNAMRPLVPSTESILDAGCGDGYYLGSLVKSGGCGVDISTAAIDLAARRYPDAQWVVANADRFIPYADASFDVVMSITGRLNRSEFRRVIRDDGSLVVAISAPDDLMELRGAARDRVSRTIEMFAADFELIERQRATTTADLDGESVRDLLTATYRPRDAAASRVTLSLDLLRFRVSGSRAK